MSAVFAKKKGKRSRSSSNESNNSFVKNVASRVSNLLPATITKWFSSASSSSANGSALAADTTDSSTEDEGPEDPVITQPPAKRMRYTVSGSKYNQYTPLDGPANQGETSEIQSHNLYSSMQSSPVRNTYLRDPNYASTPYISPAEVSSTDVNSRDRIDRDLTYKSPHIVSATSQSVAVKRKSIFDTSTPNDKIAKPSEKPASSPSKDLKQPYYKPAYFGSPFYQGRTTYGGASASTYINHPNIKQQKVAYVRESTDDKSNVNMSYSARKVMDLLENYSSPLMEAKRIPIIPKYSMNTTDYSMRADKSIPGTSRSSYKRQELYIPTMASILRIKQRSRLMETTKVARQIIASHSSTLGGFQSLTSNQKASNKETVTESPNKIKTRLTRPNRGEDPFEMPEPVQLPTAVLQIDKNNLPKFSAGLLPSTNTSTPLHSPYTPKFQTQFASAAPTQTTAVSSKNSSAPAETSTTESPQPNQFKFAKPGPVSPESSLIEVTTPPKFTFGSPEKNVDQIKDSKEKNLPPTITNKTEKPVIPSTAGKASDSKEWSCPSCKLKNKDVETCLCCSAKRPDANASQSKPDKCSVCKFAASVPGANKCVNCEKASTQGNKSIPLPIPMPADPTKWKCDGCWLSNAEKAEKCVSCGTQNPKLVAAAPAPVEKDWKCKDCWITNKSSVDKCAACGGVKPRKGPEVAAPLDKKLAEIVKAQKDKWECPGCLVLNDSHKQQCICCDMERAGVSKEITSKPFTFPKESNVTFKFGIDPKVQEPARKLQETETNNNIPTFTFTLPSKKSDDKLDAKNIESPKMTFKFGIPKSASAETTPSFGAPAEEKPQEVPKVNNSEAFQEVGKTFGSGFFAPPTSFAKPSQETSKLPAFPSGSASQISEAKTPSQFSAAGPSTEEPKAKAFTFGASTESSASASLSSGGLFGAKSTDATTSGFSFGVTQQSTPTVTTATTSSMFQTPVSNASSANMNMFGMSQPTTAATAAPAPTPVQAAAPAQAPAAPLFSFGSNVQSTTHASDKSKFNFTFGSANTSETPAFGSGFKPTFGSTDNNNTSNAFAMSTPALMQAAPMSASVNEMSNSMTSELPAANMQSFGASGQTNVWNAGGATNNVFGNNTAMQEQASFTFGAPNPFNGGPGASATQPAPSIFGNQQPAQNPFGMPSAPSNIQPGLFGNQNTNMFGNAQPNTGMFGSPAATPAFGAPAAAAPTFEAPSMAQGLQPAFNFGAQQSSGVFGFGAQTQQQTQQQAQSQQPGVYNFGGGMTPTMGGGIMGGVQFSMGSAGAGAGAISARRLRKAVRRNPQR